MSPKPVSGPQLSFTHKRGHCRRDGGMVIVWWNPRAQILLDRRRTHGHKTVDLVRGVSTAIRELHHEDPD